MKFGDTLYQRSVPQWAGYNVNYNEIKNLIKQRTSNGVAAPISIPSQGSNKREQLEDELSGVLTEQYNNISLFLKSKYGEIDRRLQHLERQVRSAQRLVDYPDSRPVPQARRYNRLLQEAGSVGEDIQSLSRFASVQKTAFRKLLKKYRKWTGSLSLQKRMEVEVFSKGQLDLDFVTPLERLSKLTKVITEGLREPMVRGQSPKAGLDRRLSPARLRSGSSSAVHDINKALQKGPLNLDAALANVPFGRSSGLVRYWIHPDNLDEAKVLLLRHTEEVDRSPQTSRHNSITSLDSQLSQAQSNGSTGAGGTHVVLFDNLQRFLKDGNTARPSRAALTARWSHHIEAAVSISDLALRDPSAETVRVRRKDLPKALARDSDAINHHGKKSTNSVDILRIQEFLAQHRDVKPLAEMHSRRSRYASRSNSSTCGTWATLDTDIVMAPYSSNSAGSMEINVESGEAFPHAVLEIRWEFGHTPEVVRAFDTTHLAERVQDFSLGSAAIFTLNKELEPPSWRTLLEQDIRKVPITNRVANAQGRTRTTIRTGNSANGGLSSGPPSTDDPADSVFSAAPVQSSATSDGSPEASMRHVQLSKSSRSPVRTSRQSRKKRARIAAASPSSRPGRYWNEFDDGDSDRNQNEVYTIYIDPNERFPGAEAWSRMTGAISHSMSQAKTKAISWLPSQKKDEQAEATLAPNERTLLIPKSDPEDDSSDSDSSPTEGLPTSVRVKRAARPASRSSRRSATRLQYQTRSPRLSARRKLLEQTLFQFYSGLLAVSYMLLFISGILLSSGRKKAALQVDTGVFAGIITSFVCTIISFVLVYMRRTKLSVLHKSVVGFSGLGVVLVGVGELVALIGRSE